MARSRAAGTEVSLFPFLSVLACLIGALTLIITALSLASLLQGREDEDIARAEDYLALQRTMDERAREIARRQEELQRTSRAAAELATLRIKPTTLENKIKAAMTEAAKLAERKRRKTALEKQTRELDKQLQSLRAELAEGRRKLGELAVMLARGAPLRILSTSSYYRKAAPVFVEAQKEQITIHSPSRQVEIPHRAIANHKDYKQVVDFVAAKDNRIIVFLVRAEGRSTFLAAESTARRAGAVTSKVPLPGDGEIDLREFHRVR